MILLKVTSLIMLLQNENRTKSRDMDVAHDLRGPLTKVSFGNVGRPERCSFERAAGGGPPGVSLMDAPARGRDPGPRFAITVG